MTSKHTQGSVTVETDGKTYWVQTAGPSHELIAKDLTQANAALIAEAFNEANKVNGMTPSQLVLLAESLATELENTCKQVRVLKEQLAESKAALKT